MGSNRITVVDAGPIIHLDQIDSLQLLSVFDSVVAPETVYKGLSAGEIPEDLGNLEYEIRTAEGDTAYEGLDKGETEIVRDALQQYLQEVEDDETFQEAVMELYLGDEIGFETLKEFIGRQDAEAVQASKNTLKQGDDLADDLAEL
jgi:predicted nucleic acid-binding protein